MTPQIQFFSGGNTAAVQDAVNEYIVDGYKSARKGVSECFRVIDIRFSQITCDHFVKITAMIIYEKGG